MSIRESDLPLVLIKNRKLLLKISTECANCIVDGLTHLGRSIGERNVDNLGQIVQNIPRERMGAQENDYKPQ